jgi:hypothetical protein
MAPSSRVVTSRHGMPWARRLFKSGRRYGKTARNATAGAGEERLDLNIFASKLPGRART